MSESIRTVWNWEIGGDRYYYEMPAFDSVHAECKVMAVDLQNAFFVSVFAVSAH